MKEAKIGQSVIEYLIIFGIVVGAIIVTAGIFKPQVQSAYNDLAAAIKSKVK